VNLQSSGKAAKLDTIIKCFNWYCSVGVDCELFIIKVETAILTPAYLPVLIIAAYPLTNVLLFNPLA
jgi:hypothetical protein